MAKAKEVLSSGAAFTLSSLLRFAQIMKSYVTEKTQHLGGLPPTYCLQLDSLTSLPQESAEMSEPSSANVLGEAVVDLLATTTEVLSLPSPAEKEHDDNKNIAMIRMSS